jgi:hypothetical protein
MVEENEEYIDINAFLEEMVSMINNRLKKQEETIGRLEADICRLKSLAGKEPKEKPVRIDKSVLKILRQK